MVGAGGIYANYVKDVAFELAKDHSHALALVQLQKTKIWQIFSGFRGEVRSDVTSLVDTMVMVADLAVNHPSTSIPSSCTRTSSMGGGSAPSMSKSFYRARRLTLKKPSDMLKQRKPPNRPDNIHSALSDPSSSRRATAPSTSVPQSHEISKKSAGD
jgi:hypothetical protein